jgi:hypothetical protein
VKNYQFTYGFKMDLNQQGENSLVNEPKNGQVVRVENEISKILSDKTESKVVEKEFLKDSNKKLISNENVKIRFYL